MRRGDVQCNMLFARVIWNL